MSFLPSHGEYADQKAAGDEHKRTDEEQMDHLRQHGFKGPKYRRKRAAIVAPIECTTPPELMVMWVYLWMTFLTLGWFGCSLVGAIAYGNSMNHFSFEDFMNLPKLFDTLPVNRWAVNIVVSTIMLIFFVSQYLRFSALKYREKREGQKEFAESAGHLRGNRDMEAGQEFESFDPTLDGEEFQPETGTGSIYPTPGYSPPVYSPQSGSTSGGPSLEAPLTGASIPRDLSPAGPLVEGALPGETLSAAAMMRAGAAGAGALSSETARLFNTHGQGDIPHLQSQSIEPRNELATRSGPPIPPALRPTPNPQPTLMIPRAYPSSTPNIGGMTHPGQRHQPMVGSSLESGPNPWVEASVVPGPDPRLPAPLTSAPVPRTAPVPEPLLRQAFQDQVPIPIITSQTPDPPAPIPVIRQSTTPITTSAPDRTRWPKQHLKEGRVGPDGSNKKPMASTLRPRERETIFKRNDRLAREKR